MSLVTPKFAAVIPAYNEASTIHEIVVRTLKFIPQVIVVDDGSSDNTASACYDLPVLILRHFRNQGKAAALWFGMQQAIKNNATAIITLDGDGQHEPEDIPALIAMSRWDPLAIVIGARLHNTQGIPLARYIANRIANFWISWAAGQPIRDSQSGFRVYPASVLQTAGSQCDHAAGFVFESEVLIEAGRQGIPIRSVPVSAHYGHHLRKSHFHQTRDITLITRMIASKLLSRRFLDVPGLMRSFNTTSSPQKGQSCIQVTRSVDPKLHRRRILFLVESITLAHMARTVMLAQSLDPARFEVHLVCDPRYLSLFEELGFPVHNTRSITSKVFQDRMAKGDPLYTTEDLRQYVQEDLRVMTEIEPDLVVGDFRLSLSVSARLVGVPYVTVTNAYWSPYARPRYLVPELPITQRVGPRLAQGLFSLIQPFVFAQHAYSLNMVRREYGQPTVGQTLAHIYSEADYTLYLDLPQLVPTFNLPSHHRYIGPVIWSFDKLPCWWSSLRDKVPTAYVTMGTSGREDVAHMVAHTLACMGWQVLMATANRRTVAGRRGHVWTADYLPGLAAARRADLVVCNGGSAAVYQALAVGTPVLGIPMNLDQYLMMDYIQRFGAGDVIRAGLATSDLIMRTVHRMVDLAGYKTQATQVRDQIGFYRAEDRFQTFIDDLLQIKRSSSMVNA